MTEKPTGSISGKNVAPGHKLAGSGAHPLRGLHRKTAKGQDACGRVFSSGRGKVA